MTSAHDTSEKSRNQQAIHQIIPESVGIFETLFQKVQGFFWDFSEFLGIDSEC